VSNELTPVQFRRLTKSVEIFENPAEEIAYQHTVFCQTCLPYKAVAEGIWERRQGAVFLRVEAGAVRKPGDNKYIDVGLPFGSRPRLILAHLNRQAILYGSPRIDVEGSLTGFIRRVTPNNAPNGRDIARFKDQLTRFAAANIRMSVDLTETRSYQVNTQIIRAMELWFQKDDRQRCLWPAFVELSREYFESLAKHAVPLDERAIAALSNNSMALDVYAWLAQRLCRVRSPKGQFIAWPLVQAQFGQGYSRLRDFRRVFCGVLALVGEQYRRARVDVTEQGLTLHESHPPVAGVIQRLF
jgi:hypothetical protein